MKKVLLVGNIWPYHRNAGSCIYAIARFLPEYGWEPVVLTTPLPEPIELHYRVIEVPYRDILQSWAKRLGFDTGTSIKKQVSRKLNITAKKSFVDWLFLRMNEILYYPDGYNDWRSSALRTGSDLIDKEDIKAIISDSPPVSGMIVASRLKKRHRIPWIVYFSHLWSQNNGYPFSSFRKFFDRRLELKTLSNVDIMTALSEPMAAKQRPLVNGKPMLAVFQGFEPETVNDPPAKVTDKFTITYTGSFAVGLREPTMLFIALQNLISRNLIDIRQLEVRFYGSEEVWIDAEIARHGLTGVAKQYGLIPLPEAQAKQRESQILFNPKWDDPEEPGIHAGKLYEYLAARRPILAMGKYKDVADDMIEDTGAGICASAVEDVEHILEEMYREYREKGEVTFRGDTSKVEKYSHREAARIICEELDSLT